MVLEWVRVHGFWQYCGILARPGERIVPKWPKVPKSGQNSRFRHFCAISASLSETIGVLLGFLDQNTGFFAQNSGFLTSRPGCIAAGMSPNKVPHITQGSLVETFPNGTAALRRCCCLCRAVTSGGCTRALVWVRATRAPCTGPYGTIGENE